MQDKKIKPLEDDLLTGVGGGSGGDHVCGLKEGQFPQQGTCFEVSRSISGLAFEEVCPYCNTWISMPEGVNLVVAHIFECSLYGYVKRETD